MKIHNYTDQRRTLTINTNPATTIPLGVVSYNRECEPNQNPGCFGPLIDIMLERDVWPGLGLRVEVAVRSDGTVWFAGTKPYSTDNRYWHFSREWAFYHPDKLDEQGIGGDEARKITKRRPTPAQLETLAKLYLGIDEPFGLGGLGMPVCKWAFEGYSADQLSVEFGNGSPVYLA